VWMITGLPATTTRRPGRTKILVTSPDLLTYSEPVEPQVAQNRAPSWAHGESNQEQTHTQQRNQNHEKLASIVRLPFSRDPKGSGTNALPFGSRLNK
jgi:hypothetical protein